jgi:uncharacterized membrane protein
MTGRLAGRTEGIAVPATILGAGLGGFVDGILLHQLLQWHHMLSSVDPPDSVPSLQMNTVGDGLLLASEARKTLMRDPRSQRAAGGPQAGP